MTTAAVDNVLSLLTPCQCQDGEIVEFRTESTDLSTSEKHPGLPRAPAERGPIRYVATLGQPMIGIPVRVGEVRYMQSGRSSTFRPATLTLYANGFTVRMGEIELGDDSAGEVSIAWSPFSLVQACRLHSMKADLAMPWLRLFKVSVFHHGSTHFFAVEGEDADLERTRWVADLSRALRVFTQSLFVPFDFCVEPIPNIESTGTRILAGYLLKCEKKDVLLVYGELHAHMSGRALFAFYEDSYCACKLFCVVLDESTPVSEHVAVDCSCFTLDCHHFTVRSSAEKSLWLRAISNLKVKLRHARQDPTQKELMAYRESISECIKSSEQRRQDRDDANGTRQKPLLPKRRQPRNTSAATDGDFEDKVIKVDFSPGALGIDVESHSGEVGGVVLGSQAERQGVLAGMVIFQIDRRPYSQALLAERINGLEEYEVTFIKVDHAQAGSVVALGDPLQHMPDQDVEFE